MRVNRQGCVQKVRDSMSDCVRLGYRTEKLEREKGRAGDDKMGACVIRCKVLPPGTSKAAYCFI